MKKVIAKYPIKIGKTLIPMGTEGIVASLEEVRNMFPDINYNPNSNQVTVKFLDLGPCIVHKSQIILAK